MRIMLSAPYELRPVMEAYSRHLEHSGHVVTSRWVTGAHELNSEVLLPGYCLEDEQDVKDANVLLFYAGPGARKRKMRGGAHTEVGMALAQGKTVLILGSRQNVFHFHPNIVRLANFAAADRWLGSNRPVPVYTMGGHVLMHDDDGLFRWRDQNVDWHSGPHLIETGTREHALIAWGVHHERVRVAHDGRI